MTLTYELQPVWAVFVSDEDKQVLLLPDTKQNLNFIHMVSCVFTAIPSFIADHAHASLRHVGIRVLGGHNRAHHDGLEVADEGEDEAEIARVGDGDNEGSPGRQGRPRDAAEDVGQRGGEGAHLSPRKWGRGKDPLVRGSQKVVK